jgi:hypothetical protein
MKENIWQKEKIDKICSAELHPNYPSKLYVHCGLFANNATGKFTQISNKSAKFIKQK